MIVVEYSLFRVRVFNASFKNISVLLMKETKVPRENHSTVASHRPTLKYTSPWAGIELTMLAVICTDCIGSYKSN